MNERPFGLGLATGSLVALGMSSIPAGWTLTATGTLHVSLVAVGVAYLLVRARASAGQEKGRLPWGSYLVTLSLVFLLSEYRGASGAWGWLFLLRSSLVAAGVLGLLISRSRIGPVGKADAAVAILLVVVCAVSILRNAGVPVSESGWVRWSGPLWLVQAGLTYLVATRVLRQGDPARERALVYSLLLTFALLAVTGVCRLGLLVHTSQAAVQALADGRYDDADRLAARALEANNGLQLGWADGEPMAQRMLAVSRTAGQGPDVLAVVGGIAERIGAWESAVSAFSAAALRAPDRTGLRGRWGTSLFEQGFRNEALAVLTDTAAVGGKDGQTRLALAVVLARMARWPEAAAVFRSQAVDLGVPSLLGPDRARVITVSLDSLLPPGNGQQLEKLAAFEMVGVMEEMGWRVYHPGTTIGRTVVVTPVDIVAVSGGGTSAPDESIRIGASQISRHLRGYNMVVLDPVSGAVTRELNYDTWRNQADCQRLAAELNSLERGAIVVGVVHEPGTKELTASARLAMERLGLSAIPGDGWSHAFVGVQGAEKGTALEAKAKSARAVVGALRANIDGELARDPGRLAQYLVEQAAQAEGGVAVYVAESGGRASFVVARAR